MPKVKKSRKIIFGLFFSLATATLIIGPLAAIGAHFDERSQPLDVGAAFRRQLLGFNNQEDSSSLPQNGVATTIVLPLSYVGPTMMSPGPSGVQGALDQIWHQIGPMMANTNGCLTYGTGTDKVEIPLDNVTWQPFGGSASLGAMATLVTTQGKVFHSGPFSFVVNPWWQQASALQTAMTQEVGTEFNGQLSEDIYDGCSNGVSSKIQTIGEDELFNLPERTVVALSPAGVPTWGECSLIYKTTNLVVSPANTAVRSTLANVLGVKGQSGGGIIPITNKTILGDYWKSISNVNHQLELNKFSYQPGIYRGGLEAVLNAMLGLFYPQGIFRGSHTYPHFSQDQLPCPWYSPLTPSEVGVTQLREFFNQDFLPYFLNYQNGSINITTKVQLPDGNLLSLSMNPGEISFVPDGAAFLMEYAGVKSAVPFTITTNPLTGLIEGMINAQLGSYFKQKVIDGSKLNVGANGSVSGSPSPDFKIPANSWAVLGAYEYSSNGGAAVGTVNPIQFNNVRATYDVEGTPGHLYYACSYELSGWVVGNKIVPATYKISFDMYPPDFQIKSMVVNQPL